MSSGLVLALEGAPAASETCHVVGSLSPAARRNPVSGCVVAVMKPSATVVPSTEAVTKVPPVLWLAYVTVTWEDTRPVVSVLLP